MNMKNILLNFLYIVVIISILFAGLVLIGFVIYFLKGLATEVTDDYTYLICGTICSILIYLLTLILYLKMRD